MPDFKRPGGPTVTWNVTSTAYPENSALANGTLKCFGCKLVATSVPRSEANDHAKECLGTEE